MGALAAVLGPVGIFSGHSEFDTVIANGRVIDPETKLDGIRFVGIRGGRIAAVTKAAIKGRRMVDASGLVVAPGFIDPISHGQNVENDQIQVFDGVTTKLQMESGVPDQAEWHRSQKGKRICNFGAGVGHPTVRGMVMGRKESEETPSTPDQIGKMVGMVRKQLQEGALGVGFGFEYQPGTTRREVFEMFKVAAEFRASCHPHIRFGTLLEEQSVITAIEEVIACAYATGAPLHIVHVPSMALGNTPFALQLIEAAQKRGMNLTCDFYPYTAFGTGVGSEVFADGWQKKFGIDYKDLEWAETHERLSKETFEKYRAEGKGMCIAHAIPENSVRAAVQSPGTMVGSDGGLEHGVGHPRSSGTFCRVLGHYARDLKLISLPAAIEKMTLRPARRMQGRCAAFARKGRVQVGADADLVVLDANKVIDRATFEKPGLTSLGMHHVFINGSAVIRDGKLLEQLPGHGLRA